MNQYKFTFEKDDEIIAVEAANHKAALEALILKVGSEAESAQYIFRSAIPNPKDDYINAWCAR